MLITSGMQDFFQGTLRKDITYMMQKCHFTLFSQRFHGSYFTEYRL